MRDILFIRNIKPYINTKIYSTKYYYQPTRHMETFADTTLEKADNLKPALTITNFPRIFLIKKGLPLPKKSSQKNDRYFTKAQQPFLYYRN
jgi:hypothetical protein